MTDVPYNSTSTDNSNRTSTPGTTNIRMAVLLLLTIHASLLAYAATRHSPTFNEPGHLVAGISHWQFGRFELYRVNPPLSHMIAALPVIAVGAETDWNNFHESPGARPIFSMGREFIAANGERSIWLFTLARLACIPFSLLGGYICFRWARELYGVAAGILASILWCFSPNILAHAELVTPDIAATSLGVTAAYVFWHWLEKSTWSQALLAGLVLGLAELTKFTWVILFGLWPLLWIIFQLKQQRKPENHLREPRRWFARGSQLTLILLLAIYVINLGYRFEGSGTRLGKFNFVSATLKGTGQKATESGNRFRGTIFENVPVPFPRNYLLGIDIQREDFENFRHPSYLRGKFQNRGWWYYYLYAAAIKVPLGTWVLFLLTCLSYAKLRKRMMGTISDSVVLLLPVVVIFALVSSQTGFSHHFRYVLPCFPFVFIWISQIATTIVRSQWKSVVASFAILWTIASSLGCYPHHIAYFNELVGGPEGGRAHLIHSSLDWGQDLLHLKDWQEKHSQAKPLNLVYYGNFDPANLGIDFAVPSTHPKLRIGWESNRDRLMRPGWYAISVNYLVGYPWRSGKYDYSYFDQLQPVAKAGESIYIYHLSNDKAMEL